MQLSRETRQIVERLLAEGYSQYISAGLEFNKSPILVAIFSDIGAEIKPKYRETFDNSAWRDIPARRDKKPAKQSIYRASDCTIEQSGKPGSIERINALQAYYSEQFTLENKPGAMAAVIATSEHSPFAVTLEEIAEQLASLALAGSKRAQDLQSPCYDVPRGKVDMLFAKHHIAGTISEE